MTLSIHIHMYRGSARRHSNYLCRRTNLPAIVLFKWRLTYADTYLNQSMYFSIYIHMCMYVHTHVQGLFKEALKQSLLVSE